MNINAVKYSDVAKNLAIKIFSELRPTIQLPEDTIKGERFNGDFRLQWILESQTVEEEFIKDPRIACEKALIEAARSDHWYKYEKKWEDDYSHEDTGEDCAVIDE